MRRAESMSVEELLRELELDATASFDEVTAAYNAQLHAWDPYAFSLDDEPDVRAMERTCELMDTYHELQKRWEGWMHRTVVERPSEFLLEEENMEPLLPQPAPRGLIVRCCKAAGVYFGGTLLVLTAVAALGAPREVVDAVCLLLQRM